MRWFVWIAACFVVMTLCSGEIPEDWKDLFGRASLLYSPSEPSSSSMMPYVGNGYAASVVGSDTVYVGGVFNGQATKGPSHRARIPSTFSVQVTNSVTDHCGLNIRDGVYIRRAHVRSDSGRTVNIEQRWYAHRVYSHLLVCDVFLSVPSMGSEPRRGVSFSDAEVVHLSVNTGGASGDIDFKSVDVSIPGAQGQTGSTRTPELATSPKTQVAVVFTTVPSTVSVPSGPPTHLQFLTVIRSSVESPPPSDLVAAAVEEYRAVSKLSPEALYDGHCGGWQLMWTGGVEVDSLALGQVINASLYYILSSLNADHSFSLSPGSLSSNGYNGHVFWDTETWMYPPILLFHPKLAASMLTYRAQRIAQAEEKAKSYKKGYVGAMFPWESAFTGAETCPEWALTGLLEQHISSDIVLAVRNAYWLSGDRSMMKTLGWPIAKGVATFWASRVSWDSSGAHINGIIPPDEYAENVDDSAFTNAAAAMALNFACDVAPQMGEQCAPEWKSTASSLVIPFDSAKNYHPEFKGYHGQTIKQADVVLMGYPLEWEMTKAVRRNDLTNYEKVTDANGPAMTWGMHSLAWLELGDATSAASNFKRSYANAQSPFLVWTETPKGGTTNFITGAGGFLQSVTYGYGGIRIRQDGVDFAPTLPPNVTRFMIKRVQMLGSGVDVLINQGKVQVRLSSWELRGGLCAVIGEKTVPIPSTWITIGQPTFRVIQCPP